MHCQILSFLSVVPLHSQQWRSKASQAGFWCLNLDNIPVKDILKRVQDDDNFVSGCYTCDVIRKFSMTPG